MDKEKIALEKEIRDAQNANNYKKKKFIALYQARTILASIGTMAERRLCRKTLKIMKSKK